MIKDERSGGLGGESQMPLDIFLFPYLNHIYLPILFLHLQS